jgi:hypothetical protein
MKTRHLTLLAGLAIFAASFGIQAADMESQSDMKKKDEAQQVQPHSHPRDAKGIPTNPPKKPDPVKDEATKKKVHTHPKDGK